MGSPAHLHFDPNAARSRPNVSQESFLRQMRPGAKMLYRAGWGTGKSTCAAFCAQRLAHLNPGVNGLVVSHTHNHVSVNLVPKIIAHLKAAGTFRGQHKNDRLIYLSNGAVVQYGSADRPGSTEGNDVGWCIGDEIRLWPAESFGIVDSRVRDKRAAYPARLYFSTPDANWMQDEFQGNPEYLQIQASTYDNQGNLQPDYIPRLLSRCSAVTVRQFVYADWGVATGTAFPEWDADVHVQDGLAEGARTVHLAWDFGFNRPAVIYLTHHRHCSRHGTEHCFHVVGEYLPNDIGTNQMVWEVRADLQMRGWQDLNSYIDPAGAAKNIQTGIADIEILRQAGFDVEFTYSQINRSVRQGTEHIRSKLRPADGSNPSIYLDAGMVTGPASEGYRGLRDAFGRAKADNVKQAYHKDGHYDHALDAFRYAVINLHPVVDQSMGTF